MQAGGLRCVRGSTTVDDMQNARPKLEDVARVAGVSRTAASRAINGQPGTTDAVRRRVRDVATELGFRPHAAAQALAAGLRGEGQAETIEMLIVDRSGCDSWPRHRRWMPTGRSAAF